MEKARTLRAATTCTAWLALLIEMILAVGSSSEQTTQQKQEVVKTIAGGTISGYENAVGTHAKFDAPIAVAVLRDARPGATKDDQSVLVADSGGYIRQIMMSTSMVSTLTAQWTGSRKPGALMIDPSQTMLYFTDTVSGQLRSLRLDAGAGSCSASAAGLLTECAVTTIAYTWDQVDQNRQENQPPPHDRMKMEGTASERKCCRGTSGFVLGLSDDARHQYLYLASPDSNNIVRVDLSKNYKLSIVANTDIGQGSANGDALTQARFSGPRGVSISPDGRFIYVADTGNHLIRRIDCLRDAKNGCYSTSLHTVTVTTIAGKPRESGCVDGSGAIGGTRTALLNGPQAVAVHPNGEKLFFVDAGSHVLRQITLPPDRQYQVTTLAGSCNSGGSGDGSPSVARFNSPLGLVVSPGGDLAIVADTTNNMIRSYGVCDTSACPYGQWRAPCDVNYFGRCTMCTRSINATITKAASDASKDTCEWQCAVGHWQNNPLPCPKAPYLIGGDPARPCAKCAAPFGGSPSENVQACARCAPCTKVVPKNASFSTNGGLKDDCKWACDPGFKLNAAGDGCSFIPLSNCFESTVVVDKSACAGQNFTLKGCAANARAHLEITQTLASWTDSYLNQAGKCDELLHKGPASMKKALRAFLAGRSSTAGSLLISPAEDLRSPSVTLLQPVNDTGLCGLFEAVPKHWDAEAGSSKAKDTK